MNHSYNPEELKSTLKGTFKKLDVCKYCGLERYTDFGGWIIYWRNGIYQPCRPECEREDEPKFQEAMGEFND